MQTTIGSQRPVFARSPKTQVFRLLILLIGFTPVLASAVTVQTISKISYLLNFNYSKGYIK